MKRNRRQLRLAIFAAIPATVLACSSAPATAPTTAPAPPTPIVIRWDYLALGDRDSLKGNPNITVVVPKSGVLGGVSVQAISAYAPHPNAAKLWKEWLYADDGRLTWLKAYGHPIRYQDLGKRGVVTADLAAKLPSADLYAKAAFPTIDQLTSSKTTITGGWDKTVNVNIK